MDSRTGQVLLTDMDAAFIRVMFLMMWIRSIFVCYLFSQDLGEGFVASNMRIIIAYVGLSIILLKIKLKSRKSKM